MCRCHWLVRPIVLEQWCCLLACLREKNTQTNCTVDLNELSGQKSQVYSSKPLTELRLWIALIHAVNLRVGWVLASGKNGEKTRHISAVVSTRESALYVCVLRRSSGRVRELQAIIAKWVSNYPFSAFTPSHVPLCECVRVCVAPNPAASPQ